MRPISNNVNEVGGLQVNVANRNNSGPRRAAPHQSQPGAFAVEGPDPGVSLQVRRPENQASIVRANAVDDAKLVVYASSVSPDERVKMRRRIMIGAGVVALLIIIGLSIGLTFKSFDDNLTAVPTSGHGADPLGPPISTDPRCLLPVHERDVVAQCVCSNTTEYLNLTHDETQLFFELRSLLLNRSVIDNKHAINSCDPQNQCIVWQANYERRNETDNGTYLTMDDKDRLVQSYALCSTYLGLAGWIWERNDSWIESENFCDWYGVICSFLLRVTSLELPSNGLNGTLTSEIRHMSFLREYMYDYSHESYRWSDMSSLLFPQEI